MNKNSITILACTDIKMINGGTRNMESNFSEASGVYDKFLRKGPIRFSLSNRAPLDLYIDFKKLDPILLMNSTIPKK